MKKFVYPLHNLKKGDRIAVGSFLGTITSAIKNGDRKVYRVRWVGHLIDDPSPFLDASVATKCWKKLKKEDPHIVVECKSCFKVVLEVRYKKDVPKNVVCPHCGVGQSTESNKRIGYSNKRNYPEEYLENQ